MQFTDAKLSRSSLLLSLKRYSAAVRNMEQTVLIPSLLREVPADDVLSAATHDAAAEEDARDLYECYLMLKAVRNTVDSGLAHPSDDVASAKGKGQGQSQGRTGGLWKETEELELLADPEVLFQFHLRGLFSVMGHLTKTSQSLTAKYMDILGIHN